MKIIYTDVHLNERTIELKDAISIKIEATGLVIDQVKQVGYELDHLLVRSDYGLEVIPKAANQILIAATH